MKVHADKEKLIHLAWDLGIELPEGTAVQFTENIKASAYWLLWSDGKEPHMLFFSVRSTPTITVDWLPLPDAEQPTMAQLKALGMIWEEEKWENNIHTMAPGF